MSILTSADLSVIDLSAHSPYTLARELETRIVQLDRDTDSRFSLDYASAARAADGGPAIHGIQPKYRWAVCFPVTGGSEGWYLHVVAIYQRDENGNYLRENRYVDLALVKIFGGWDAAAELAGLIGQWLDA